MAVEWIFMGRFDRRMGMGVVRRMKLEDPAL